MKNFRISLLLCCTIIFLPNTSGAQLLKPGDLAPALVLTDIYGEQHTIGNNNSSKIFVGFMRYVGCPVCNFRTHDIISNYEAIQANGYQVILIFQSEQSTLLAYLEDKKPPFPIISDPKRRLYKKYGVEPSFWKTLKSAFNKNARKARKYGKKKFDKNQPKRDGDITGIPADFIIDKKGNIIEAYYGKTIADHLPLEKLTE